MTTITDIESRLRDGLAPTELELVDESAMHAGHAGAASGGGHYRLRIVSPRFAGLARIARHRLVYDSLSDLMRNRHPRACNRSADARRSHRPRPTVPDPGDAGK